MNWILDHLQLAIALAIGLAAWIKKIRSESQRRDFEREAKAHPNQMLAPPVITDEAAAERTQQIQQEIRRKIEERSRQVEERVEAWRLERTPVPEATFRTPATPPPLITPAPIATARDEQRKVLAAEIIRLREERRAASRADHQISNPSPAFTSATTVDAFSQVGSSTPDWRLDLMNPDNVRRAFVLKEILGSPLGLR
jgi:hypothetical protein